MKRILSIAATVAVTLAAANSASAQVLYKVEKEGSDKVSYILGTHHFAPLSAVDSIKELPAIFQNVDKVYGELDMADMQNPQKLGAMQMMLMAPADSTLTILLTPEQKDSVVTTWTEYTGDTMQINAMLPMVKPSAISTALAAAMSTKALPDLNPLEGIDATMQKRAKEAGKPVEGLETMEYQMDMLYNRPISEQLEGLLKTVRSAQEEGEKAVQLANAYIAHDINKLFELMADADKENPEAMERMIYTRNDNWVKHLAGEMPTVSSFVVVGAGHLPGERGVLEGLRKAGFTITPID